MTKQERQRQKQRLVFELRVLSLELKAEAPAGALRLSGGSDLYYRELAKDNVQTISKKINGLE